MTQQATWNMDKAYVEHQHQESVASLNNSVTDSKSLLPRQSLSRRRLGWLLRPFVKQTPDVIINDTHEESYESDSLEPDITRARRKWRLLFCWRKSSSYLSRVPSWDSSLTSFPVFCGKMAPPPLPPPPLPPSSVQCVKRPQGQTSQHGHLALPSQRKLSTFSPDEETWKHHVQHFPDWSPIGCPKEFTKLTQTIDEASNALPKISSIIDTHELLNKFSPVRFPTDSTGVKAKHDSETPYQRERRLWGPELKKTLSLEHPSPSARLLTNRDLDPVLRSRSSSGSSRSSNFEDGPSDDSWAPEISKRCAKCNKKIGAYNAVSADESVEEVNPYSVPNIDPFLELASIRSRVSRNYLSSTLKVTPKGRPPRGSTRLKPTVQPDDFSLVSMDSLTASYRDGDQAKSPATPLMSNRYAEHLEFLQHRVSDK